MKQSLFFLLFAFFLASCDSNSGPEGSQAETPEIKTLAPAKVSETEFQLNWSVISPAGAQTIALELSEDSEMTHITKYLDVGDISTDHVLVSNLKGATRYYYRVVLLANGVAVFKSETASAVTAYRVDSVELITEDSYTLSGKLAYLESV